MHTNTIDKFWNGLVWAVFSVILRLIISIGSSILFVRYLGKIGYGSIIVLGDFVSIMIVLLSLGLGVVQTRLIPQYMIRKEYGIVKDIVLKIFTFRIGLSVLIPFLIYLNCDSLTKVMFNGVEKGLIYIALLLIPIQMTTTCFRGMLEVTYHQKLVSIGDITALLVRLTSGMIVILGKMGIIVFFATQAFTDMYLLIIYGYVFYRKFWNQIHTVARTNFTGKLWSVGVMSMLILLFGKCLDKEMDTQILSYRLKEAALPEITIYAISIMLVTRCLSFVGVGVGGVSNLTQAVMSEYVENNNINGLKSIYQSQLQLYYFIAIPLIFASYVLSDKLLICMYGNSFAGKGDICFYLFLIFGLTTINYINYPVIFCLGHETKLFKGRSFWGILNVILSYTLSIYGAIGVTIATGICLFGIATYESILVYYLIKPVYPKVFFNKILVGSASMSVAMYILSHQFASYNNYFNLIISGVLGIVLFYVAMMLLKPLNKHTLESQQGLPSIIKRCFISFAA